MVYTINTKYYEKGIHSFSLYTTVYKEFYEQIDTENCTRADKK